MQRKTVWLLILVWLISGCSARSASTEVADEIHPELKNIPVYPGSAAWSEGIPGMDQQSQTFQSYSYVARVFKVETLMDFYEDEMLNEGWDLLQKGEDNKTRSADLMFSRSKTVAHIQMIPRTANDYLVYVIFYDDPLLEQ